MGVCSVLDNNKRKIIFNSILQNIKSKYIMQKIIGNMIEQKVLEIIRYNKKLQKKLNIDIKDYKEYYEKSPIEIEIIPINSEYCKFINIPEDEELYYHIYFNDNKEEIKRNYIDINDNVKYIKIIIDYQVQSLSGLFKECGVKYIKFKKFYRDNITNMSYMFYKCSSLKELNLSKFNTNNVIDMNSIFFELTSLEELI